MYDNYDTRGIREFISLCEEAGLELSPTPEGLHIQVPSWKCDPVLEKEITQREKEIMQFFQDLDENAGLPVEMSPDNRKIIIARS